MKYKSDTFVVSLLQYSCGADPKENEKKAIELINDSKKSGAEIICLPELFNRRYFCAAFDHANFDFAESIPGPTIERFQELAKKLSVVLVVPTFERRAAGVYHNSAGVIDADGALLGVYRKMHIPDDPLYYEKFYFTPGDSTEPNGGFKVFETRYAKIGVLICWDQWYPEAARITSLLGAEILFYPTAIGWHPSEKAEYGETQVNSWTRIQQSHAIYPINRRKFTGPIVLFVRPSDPRRFMRCPLWGHVKFSVCHW